MLSGPVSPQRLSCSQLEATLKLFKSSDSAQEESSTGLAHSSLKAQYQDEDNLGIRAYHFVRNDGTHALVYQPATISKGEELGIMNLATLVSHFQQRFSSMAFNTILIPLAEVSPIFNFATSRHWVTLKLKVSEGKIVSAYPIDSRSSLTSVLTRDEDIKQVLNAAITSKDFLFHDRKYLELQTITDTTHCGYYTFNVIRSLIDTPNQSLTKTAAYDHGNNQIIYRAAKSYNLNSIQDGAVPELKTKMPSIPKPVEVLEDDTAPKKEVSLKDSTANSQSNVKSDVTEEKTDLPIIKQTKDSTEVNTVVSDSLADEKLTNTSDIQPEPNKAAKVESENQSIQQVSKDVNSLVQAEDEHAQEKVILKELVVEKPNDKLAIADICKSDEHHPFLSKRSEWMIQQGEAILADLYAADVDLGNSKSVGQVIKKLGIDFAKTSGLMDAQQISDLKHHGSLLSSLNVNGWLKSINRMVRGDDEHATDRRNYMCGVLCVMWAMYNRAALKGESFTRGSFKIVDPDARLFHLLKGYVQFATGQDDVSFKTANDFAYSRDPSYGLSSHYKGKAFMSEQYGVDFRFWGGHPVLEVLPHNHAHLLFGQVDIDNHKYTFLKFERVGLGNSLEFIEHGTHFAGAGHVEKASRREKDIPIDIMDVFGEFLKELTKYEAPIHMNPKTVAQIYQVINGCDNPVVHQYKGKLQAALENRSMVEYVKIRTGEEVILNPTEIDSDDLHSSIISKKVSTTV